MKTTRIDLIDWHSFEDTLDIDWPLVQRTIGREKIEWLLDQPNNQCQLVVDKVQDKLKLVAEFYDDKLLIRYHLMWS